MSEPIVSIIIPNHNYGAFIADAIASVKAQTLTEWECIIVDDASTDNSVEVVKECIAGDDRFKLVVNKQSLGISATRNVGLNMANGEYIAFLDSDDCYAEFFLEMLVKLARQTKVDIAGAKTKLVDSKYKFAPSGAEWNTFDFIFYESAFDMRRAPSERKWIWIWRRIYKRSLLQGIRFRDEMKINGDDVTFMLDLAWRISRVAESNIEAVYHRVHSSSVTSSQQDFNLERVAMFPLLFRHMHEHLLDKYDKAFLSDIYKNLFLYMLNESLVKYLNTLTEQNKKDLRKLLADACRAIEKKYLPFKYRLLCRYLIWKG